MKSSARPNAERSSAISAIIWACTETSSAETGSSATMKSGSVASARNRNPLALAAGKFMRQPVRMRRIEADAAQEIIDPRARRGPVGQFVDQDAVGDLIARAPT